ncbi:hypothetical protein COO60DRAFT_1459350 [Scenedesmus sp. NREL 46B-D3]|nr:hypothetical protein COO60DRAFT_1459350 [Scenedesmus sp. NREL 46B-D3]
MWRRFGRLVWLFALYETPATVNKSQHVCHSSALLVLFQIEAQTRREIEDKNQQLRQLEGFGSLAASVTGAGGAQEGKDLCASTRSCMACDAGSWQSQEVLLCSWAMARAASCWCAGQVHPDTPEVLWGCLDGQQHLEAARRLLRVQEVHGHLEGACAADIAARFPLISHQWPVVIKFREQILDVAASTLSSKPLLSSQEAADAIAAVAMLQGLGSAAALQQFLSCRRQWVQQRLLQALAATSAQQEPGAALAELAQQVQDCIAQIGELFTASGPAKPGGSSSSLLQQLLHEDEADASELYFGSMDTAGEGSNSPEAVAWRQKSSAICQQLTPLQRIEAYLLWGHLQLLLPPIFSHPCTPKHVFTFVQHSQYNQVEQACSAWLADVAAACREHGLELLHRCSSAHSLLGAEQAVLFHAAFLERAKAIIQDGLQDAAGAIHEPLRLALSQAAAHAAEPAGQLQPGSWPSILGHSAVSHVEGVVQLDRTYTALCGRTSSAAWAAGPQALSYSRSGALMLTLPGLVAASDGDPADGHGSSDAAASFLDPMEGDGGAAAGGDMRFVLPGCPSSALLQMLSLACSRTAILLEMLHQVCLRYVCPSVRSDQLDPIDWATYEPHLWFNVQRYHQRTSVLLGVLGQLHKPYVDAPRPAAAAASSDLNALNVLPVAPRFHYLPISTPTALHAGAAAAKQRALSMSPGVAGVSGFAGTASEAAAGAALAAAAGDISSSRSQASDLAAQYVLSELGSGSSGVGRAPPGLGGRRGNDAAAMPGAAGAAGSVQAVSQLHLSADSAAAAGASALSALQARLQGSGFGAFGSLLGDRAAGAAAEVSAMAQNFGDLLPSAGLGGGLLSSFARRDGTVGSGGGQATTPGSKR